MGGIWVFGFTMVRHFLGSFGGSQLFRVQKGLKCFISKCLIGRKIPHGLLWCFTAIGFVGLTACKFAGPSSLREIDKDDS